MSQQAQSNKDTQDTMDMLTALKLPEARRIFLRLLKHSNLLQASYRENALSTAYNEGLRAVGLWLKKEIDRADAEAFARLLTEEKKK